MTDPHSLRGSSEGTSERDIEGEIQYVVEHGQSPEAEAIRVLRRFMCCKAGDDLVEHGLLRPFGYSLRPGRVVSENRNLRDIMETYEIELACDAQELHDRPEHADQIADRLARLSQRMREALRVTSP
jgi:hypothetical protein